MTNSGNDWPQLAVVQDNWRLVMTKDGSRIELYDIFNDWEEKENLAGEYPEVVNRLKQIALDYNDSLPPFGSSDKRLCIPRK